MKPYIKTRIGDIFKYALICILICIPLFLYILGANCNELWAQETISYLNAHSWEEWLLIIGLIIFFLQIIILILKKNGHQHTLLAEIKFVFTNGMHAVFLGLSISFVLLSFYFLVPNMAMVDRFDTSFGIFASVMAIILGIHFLYERDAPLVGTLNLLKQINIDLKKFDGGDIYIMFPALNLGFYTDHILNEKDIYQDDISELRNRNGSVAGEFFQRIKDCKADYKANIYGVFYEEDCIRSLYNSYHYMNMKSNKKECKELIHNSNKELLKSKINEIAISEKTIIDKCINSSDWFIDLCKIKKPLKPNEFPQPIILINDIVYVIVDYGMPFYNIEKNFFEPVETEPAELIGWRRKDSALTSSIKKHLNKQIGIEK